MTGSRYSYRSWLITLIRSLSTLRRRLLITTATARYRSRCWLVSWMAVRYLGDREVMAGGGCHFPTKNAT